LAIRQPASQILNLPGEAKEAGGKVRSNKSETPFNGLGQEDKIGWQAKYA